MCIIFCMQIFITGYTSWISKNIVLHLTVIISGVAERVMYGVCDGESYYTDNSLCHCSVTGVLCCVVCGVNFVLLVICYKWWG